MRLMQNTSQIKIDLIPAKQVIILLRGTWVFGGGAPGRGIVAAGAANVQVVVGALPHRLRLAQLCPALMVPPVVEAEPGHRLHVPHLHAMYARHECCHHSTTTAVCGMAAKRFQRHVRAGFWRLRLFKGPRSMRMS